MAKKDKIVGIDFGATFVKLALISLDGIILKKDSFKTGDFASRDSLIAEMVRRARCLVDKKDDVLGIGIGVPGQVDYKKGVIFNLTNVKGWRGVNLREILKKKMGLPVYLDNDGNAVALGEMEWGAAKGYRNIVAVTLGSGVGGGLILNGEIYRGGNYAAGEIGHICIDRRRPICNCGSNGCLEAFVGNKAIAREAVRRLNKHKGSILLRLAEGKTSKITPKLISQAASKKDNLSIAIWQDIGRTIGIGLSSIINILNPDIIVIGGGISKTGSLLFKAIKASVKGHALEVSVKRLKIVRARFVEDAGVVGAAALVVKEKGCNS